MSDLMRALIVGQTHEPELDEAAVLLAKEFAKDPRGRLPDLMVGFLVAAVHLADDEQAGRLGEHGRLALQRFYEAFPGLQQRIDAVLRSGMRLQ